MLATRARRGGRVATLSRPYYCLGCETVARASRSTTHAMPYCYLRDSTSLAAQLSGADTTASFVGGDVASWLSTAASGVVVVGGEEAASLQP